MSDMLLLAGALVAMGVAFASRTTVRVVFCLNASFSCL